MRNSGGCTGRVRGGGGAVRACAIRRGSWYYWNGWVIESNVGGYRENLSQVVLGLRFSAVQGGSSSTKRGAFIYALRMAMSSYPKRAACVLHRSPRSAQHSLSTCQVNKINRGLERVRRAVRREVPMTHFIVRRSWTWHNMYMLDRRVRAMQR